MRATEAIGVRAVPGGRARRSPGCAIVRSGEVGRMSRRKGLGGMAGDVERDRIERRSGVGAASRRVEVGLTQETLEALAQRVVQLLRAEPAHEQKPFTAGQLAHYLGVERSWVYKNAHLLDGERIGEGPKAQWRFDREAAKRRLAEHRLRRKTTTGV